MSWHKLVIKDAARQLFGRIISALFWFVITKIIASYLWPLRYGDYGTIFRYFARRTALVDFWIYVIALRTLWKLKEDTPLQKGGSDEGAGGSNIDQNSLPSSGNNLLKSSGKIFWNPLIQTYHKFIGTRVFMITIIYTLAIITAYLIPAYTDNQFIIRGLPLAMLYSASNMFVGIQQLPLQLFWKMKRLSWSLIIARCSQLAVLLPVVYILFKHVDFSSEQTSWIMIAAFCLVVFSVVASSIGQNIDVHFKSKDLLPFGVHIDKPFIKKTLTSNRKYGFSYFFSSFHTLIVLMFLGRFFPTAAGFKYVGFRALALSLVEILLIIPSSLGNSLLHKIPNYTQEEKKKSLGNLLTLVFWIGALIALNFAIFDKEVIRFVSSKQFLGTRESLASRGSNQILPFLGIVLVLSFIKQVFNYLFVATDKQNVLFNINLIGVIIGVLIGIAVIPKRNLLGGVITQIIIELMFTCGAIFIAGKHKLFPSIPKKAGFHLCSILIGAGIIGFFINQYLSTQDLSILRFFLLALLFNAAIVGLSLRPLKKVAKGLTID